MIRTIPQEQWPAFVAAFSRRHEGWLVTVHGAADDACVGRRRGALRSMVLEGPPPAALALELTNEARVYVAQPRQLCVQQTPDGIEEAMEIENASGGVTRIAFRVAAPPDRVDSLAPDAHAASSLAYRLAHTVVMAAAMLLAPALSLAT